MNTELTKEAIEQLIEQIVKLLDGISYKQAQLVLMTVIEHCEKNAIIRS